MESRPELTVMVVLLSGAVEKVRTCLTTLDAQRFPGLEIMVPYFETDAEITSLSSEFPDVDFILVGGLDTRRAPVEGAKTTTRIRALALRHARGRVVAMVEDVSRVSPGWCSGLLDALEHHPEAGAVGGAIVCGSAHLINRAVCLSDFWRYQEPVPESTSPFVSDANIAYRRDLLESVRDVWADDFHETVVNGALLECGHQLWLTPAATVYQEREQLGWRQALRERYVWGRSYGGTRVKGAPLSKRLVYAAFCPVLPLLLAARAVRIAWSRGSFVSGCLPLLPVLLLLFIVWSFGEMVGYLTGRAR